MNTILIITLAFLSTACIIALLILLYVKKIIDSYVEKLVDAEKIKRACILKDLERTINYLEGDLSILTEEGTREYRYTETEVSHVKDKWIATFRKRRQVEDSFLKGIK